MIEFFDQYAEQIMLVVALILFMITFIVLGLAFFSRWRLKKRESYRNRKTDQLGELIIRYVSGEISIDKVEAKLDNRLDFVVLLELVSQLEQSLDGTEEKKLQQLINIQTIRLFFEKRFDSEEPLFQAKACLYFARKAEISVDKISRLVNLSSSDDPILSYAATTALMVHGQMDEKAIAIKNVLKNERISTMALSDILVQFTRHGAEYHEEEALLLMKLVGHYELPPDRSATLVRILNELEYLQSSDFLWEYYQKADHATTHPLLLEVLLDVLTKFGREKILDDVHNYYAVSKHANLREAAARAMGFFRKELSVPFLKWLLNDPDFMVRFEAARALGNYQDIDLKKIIPPNLSDKEWSDLAGEVLSEFKLLK